MAKAKATVKKTKTATAKAAPKKAAKAKAAPRVQAQKKVAAPRKAAASPAKTKAQSPAVETKSIPAEANWTDAIKAALERRNQQPDYPGSGSNSWKHRPKH